MRRRRTEMQATRTKPAYLPLERRAAGRKRPIRILLVEDDDDIRLLLTIALRHEGYDVTSVANADRALDAMSRRRHDLVLTDYCLPRKDGLELVAEAESTGVLAHAPVIVCTAFPPGRPAGVTILQKPIELDALLEHVRAILKR
jgi:DNA-binding response OmpR family regulator